MAQKTIKGEEAFSTMAHSMIISPSNETYTLQYSCDCENWTSWEESTPAGDNLIINGLPKNTFLRLKDNASTVSINY